MAGNFLIFEGTSSQEGVCSVELVYWSVGWLLLCRAVKEKHYTNLRKFAPEAARCAGALTALIQLKLLLTANEKLFKLCH
jgi:hypothetical protein